MEHTTDQLRVFLSLFIVHLPTLIVCAIALVLIVGRRQEGSSGYSFWALAGFGGALALCFLVPAIQTALQQWVFQSGERMSRAWVFTAFGFVVSVLHAGIYGCLLMAIIGDRRVRE
jgi:hypothetical protein